MTAAMTDSERALWVQAQKDYQHALKIAQTAWADTASTPEAIQAATATVMLHHKYLSERAAYKSTPTTAPAAANNSDAAKSQSVAAPPCPKCQGEMWDNRGKKKNPKSADFTCKQKKGECVNEKGFKTGVWLKDLAKTPAMAAATAIRDGIDSYSDMPAALEDGDDLPF
jgi:hypothetical protein